MAVLQLFNKKKCLADLITSSRASPSDGTTGVLDGGARPVRTWRRDDGLDGQAQPWPGLQHGRRAAELTSDVGSDAEIGRTRALAVL